MQSDFRAWVTLKPALPYSNWQTDVGPKFAAHSITLEQNLLWEYLRKALACYIVLALSPLWDTLLLFLNLLARIWSLKTLINGTTNDGGRRVSRFILGLSSYTKSQFLTLNAPPPPKKIIWSTFMPEYCKLVDVAKGGQLCRGSKPPALPHTNMLQDLIVLCDDWPATIKIIFLNAQSSE